jgi:lysophospholipase L1-like esterase
MSGGVAPGCKNGSSRLRQFNEMQQKEWYMQAGVARWMRGGCVFGRRFLMALGMVVLVQGGAFAEALKILPLGDSITDGSHKKKYPGAYRVHLWKLFQDAGWDVDFVGTKSNGPDELGDKDHEGWIGMWSDGKTLNAKESIALNLVHKLDSLAPDVVLLLLGTNDVFHGDSADADSVASNLRSMVRTITKTLPGVKVLVGNLVPNERTKDMRAKTIEVNATIPGLVESLKKQGLAVTFVDFFSALKATDLDDQVHPNPQGYAKMAVRWFAALEKVVPHTPTGVRRSLVVPQRGAGGAGSEDGTGLHILANGRQLAGGQGAAASLLWSVGQNGQGGSGLLWR